MFDDRFNPSALNERICLQIIEYSVRYVGEPSESVSENIERPSLASFYPLRNGKFQIFFTNSLCFYHKKV